MRKKITPGKSLESIKQQLAVVLCQLIVKTGKAANSNPEKSWS
jgi:hypothetical protein